MRRLFLFLFFMILSVVVSTTCETNCRKLAPYVTVNINLTLYGSELTQLGPGQSITIDGGVNGIILYRDYDDNYFAFDRTCPQWPDHDVAVEKDEDWEEFYSCPECHSKFYLVYDGQPWDDSGPARCPLVRYNTYVEGLILHIYN